MRLCRTGFLLGRLLQLTCDVFPNILNGPGDEHLAWNFYSDEAGRINPSLMGILLIDIQADRAIRKTLSIEGSRIRHGQSTS